MNILASWYLLCVAFIFAVYQIQLTQAEFFSQFTVYQIVFAVSWPIPYKNPLRKLFFNSGFQFNYNEPFAPSNFYNATYFQDAFTGSRDLPPNADNSTVSQASEMNGKADGSNESNESKESGPTKAAERTVENDATDIPAIDEEIAPANRSDATEPTPAESSAARKLKSRSLDSNELTGSDVSAGQLYESVERHLVEAGYDKSCLLKSICELARHPLHQEDEEEHLLMDVINFMLRPSEHNGFASHESYEREKYKAAEVIGEHGHDCDEIYSECESSFLDRFSYLDK